MRKRTKFLIFLIIFIISLTFGFSGKAKVYTKNGVTIMENQESDFTINKNIKFKENLSIGKEDGEDYEIFSQYLSIAVSQNGDLFIFDGKRYRILKFDKNGKYLWSKGRKGEGPGEFRNQFCNIYVSPSDHLIVADGVFLHFFDTNGNFLKDIKLGVMSTHIEFLKDGKMFINTFLRGQPGVASALYSSDGKLISKFPVEYRYGPKLSKSIGVSIGDGGFRVYKDRVFLSIPIKYEIREYDFKGKLFKIIKRNVKLSPPNIKVFGGGGVTVYPSDHSGPVFFDENYLINSVFKVKKKDKKKYEFTRYLDFFDLKGNYMGSYKLPKSTKLEFIDKEGYFYFFQREPFPRVYRAKLIIGKN